MLHVLSQTLELLLTVQYVSEPISKMQFFTADIGDINWRMHLEYISEGEVTLNRENATRFGCEVSV